jgi:hemoglobin
VLRDPLLQPLFGAGQPQHVNHLTMFIAESFGGHDRFSRELGFSHLIDVHRGLRITETQRQRFVELYMAALHAAGMPEDEPFRTVVREHVEFSSRVAMQTRTRPLTPSCTPCAKSHTGPGPATTDQRRGAGQCDSRRA